MKTLSIALVWLGTIASGLTQGAEEAADVAAGSSMSLQEILTTGGSLMYVLGAMSLLGLAFVFYFFFALRAKRIAPPEFLHDLQDMLIEGKLEEARNFCKGEASPASAIALTATDYLLRVENPDTDMLREVMEGEGARQGTALQTQVQYLQDIAVIAPMVGLLGTVIGMLSTFNVVALDIAKAKPMLLAQGVSQALITTAAGLIVGIPAMAFYSYFRGRTVDLLSNLEILSGDLLALLVNLKNK